jgi:hypothetical protein
VKPKADVASALEIIENIMNFQLVIFHLKLKKHTTDPSKDSYLSKSERLSRGNNLEIR